MKVSLEMARKGLAGLQAFLSHGLSGVWETPNVDALPDPPAEESSKEMNYAPPLYPGTIEAVLERYGVIGEFTDYRIGSAVTTYEIRLPIGTRFSSIMRYRDDIARDLSAPSLRIVQSLSDSSLIGLEVENSERYTVFFKQMLKDLPAGFSLPVIMGEDTYGQPIYEDLTEMPHMLVAGQTGSGKSVFLNSTIATLLCTKTPEELKLLIVDPKQVEFVAYEEVPHLLEPIACNPEEARALLDVAVEEMEHRFTLLREARVKKISDYNKKVVEGKLPYIVFIVDEFADLMMMGSRADHKEVESKIARIAQKARAAGIHMILATQKPLATIVTSLIKANMPTRVSFNVASMIDSRVILDEGGAETLTGNGDMLYRDPNARSEYEKLRRVQAPWISDEDLEILFPRS